MPSEAMLVIIYCKRNVILILYERENAVPASSRNGGPARGGRHFCGSMRMYECMRMAMYENREA